MYAYIVVTGHAVNLVLVRMENGIQKLMCVSKSLQEVETHYLPLEKVVLDIIHAIRKLPHYFQAHTMVVLMQLPFQALLQKLDYTRRIAKWGTMLGAFDVKYMPCTAIKGQVLANFVAEFTEDTGGDRRLDLSILEVFFPSSSSWEVYTDGTANQRGSSVGIVLVTPKKLVVEKSLRLGFPATNNEAKYEELLAGIKMVNRLGGDIWTPLEIYLDSHLEIYLDSHLVVGQVNGEFEARDQRMQWYLFKVKRVRNGFKIFILWQISRGKNSLANSLAMLATSSGSGLPQVITMEDLIAPSCDEQPFIQVNNIQTSLS